MLRRLNRRKAPLAKLGVHAGPARLAVDPACKYCGQCLHGCPWGYIYSARHTLAQLRTRPDFEHRRATVRRIAEDGDSASVTLDSGEVLRAGRVFVAAGVLETARLLLASRPGPDTLTLKDSQHFFLPSLHRWRAPRRPDRLPYHTLPQAFAEIDDPAISPHLVHAQIYTWNEFYAHDLIASYGARLPGSAPLWRALARRLIVSQVFLHSDHSARIGLRLAPDGRLAPTVHGNPDTPRAMAAAKARMARALGLAGLLALSPAARPGAPGSSFHVGGSVPMAATPGAGESDVLGRPEGLERVHVVDASVLPDIPGDDHHLFRHGERAPDRNAGALRRIRRRPRTRPPPARGPDRDRPAPAPRGPGRRRRRPEPGPRARSPRTPAARRGPAPRARPARAAGGCSAAIRSSSVWKSVPPPARSTISGNGPSRRAITGVPRRKLSIRMMPNVS